MGNTTEPRWVLSNALMQAYDNGSSPNAVREADFLLEALAEAGYVLPDTRIARIEALVAERSVDEYEHDPIWPAELVALLRGEALDGDV